MTEKIKQRNQRLSEYTEVELREAVDRYVTMHLHCDRNRGIVKMHLFDGIGFEKIAEKYGMSVRGVVYAYDKALNLVLKHL